MNKDELIAEVADALEQESRRLGGPILVNYWFETVGGGWVRPDWQAIAKVAVEEVLDLQDRASS